MTHGEAETLALAAELARGFRGGEVILLSGELGSGKTAFVRGLAGGLGVEPDEVSKKSLRVLDKKLQDLKTYADFDVNINSVLGGGIKNPEDARTINRRARQLG